MGGGHNYVDLTGQMFGSLTVLSRVSNSNSGKVQFECICECGNKTVSTASNLKSGITKSCGCLLQKVSAKSRISHGLRYSTEYNSWRSMKDRCKNKSHNRFQHYGGRGIIVCSRWLNSFETFLVDMGFKPDPTYSIDRIDVNGNYEPSNCRWASKSEQRVNIRK